MYFVFCELNDMPALWAYRGLKDLCLEPIELVTSQMLAYCKHLEHHVGPDKVDFKIELSNGQSIDSNKTFGVVNRLQMLPSNHLQAANQTDREYALQELFALFISWLHSLPCPVLNPASTQGLSGSFKHASEWAILSHQAGLAAPRFEQNSEKQEFWHTCGRLVPDGRPVRTVFAVGYQHILPESTPTEIAQACLRLAKLSGTPLLGINFASTDLNPWTFAGATPFPDLRAGGQPLLKAIASVLSSKGGDRL